VNFSCQMQPAIRSRVLSFILITAPEASLHISPTLRSLGGFVCWAYGTNCKFTDTIARVVSGQNSLSWKSLVESGECPWHAVRGIDIQNILKGHYKEQFVVV
jgi:hypothetical protein